MTYYEHKLPLRWKEDAPCRGMDPALFYPESYFQAAPKVCSVCPVQRTCLAYALVHRELGIWGGQTERERQAMNRRISRSKATEMFWTALAQEAPCDDSGSPFPARTAGLTLSSSSVSCTSPPT